MDDNIGENVINDKKNNEIRRQSIQAAIAKAKELRALHAALMQQSSNNNSPAKMRSHNNNNNNGVTASPVSSSNHGLHYFSAQDYPVFTPSYEDDPLPPVGYHHRHEFMMTEDWGEHIGESFCSDYRTARKWMPSEFDGHHICPLDDRNSVTGLRSPSPVPNSYSKSRRNSLGDANSVSSCNKCKPAVINNFKAPSTVAPPADPHPRVSRGLGFSMLFPRLKKKSKNKNEYSSPVHSHKDHDTLASIEALRKELTQANESRDFALTEAAEMKSLLGELTRKLESLERYCEELKNALRQAAQLTVSSQFQPEEKLLLSKIPRSIDSNAEEEHSIPVSEEVMVEGFLQIVSEARLSMKQLCKTLLEGDNNGNNLNSKHSKPTQLYHLEAIVNQSLYQDFENCVFQRNGCSKALNPNQGRLNRFQSFVALRNLSWNEVVRKGTKHYSEDFSRFCDEKMSGVITALGWTRPWPEHMLQAFFVAAKCVWLLHLLAFSFDPPLGILRVEENALFEGNYMEDIFGDGRRSSQGPSRVKVLVMPGFYVLERVLKCKVICRYKPVVVS